MRRHKALSAALLIAMIFFCLMALVSAGIGLSCTVNAFFAEGGASSFAFLLVNGVSSWAASVAWLVVVRFIILVLACDEVFSIRQSRKLLVIGGLFAFRFVAGLFLPTFSVQGPSHAVDQMLSSAPTIDISQLALAVIFFALGAVFEYGRLLQEDSDSIL